MPTKKITSLYRHLVKGFNQESLTKTQLIAGATLRGDRAFAFQFLDTEISYPAENAPWISKMSLAVQHDWPELAKILPSWNEKTQSLKLKIQDSENFIEASTLHSEGRDKLAKFVHLYMKTIQPYSKARHPAATPLRLIGNANFTTRYTDGDKGPLSLAFRESIQDLEKKFGFKVDEKRFRLNLFLDGAPAWTELTWKTGTKIKIGNSIIQIYKPIGRCPNIDVNQMSGERLDEIFPHLKSAIGHTLFGVKADILEGGEIKVGDSWQILS